TNVRLRDDFGERRATTVVVDVRLGGGLRKTLVQVFCRVILEMEPGDADALLRARYVDVEPTPGCERKLVLRDLVALGEVGVEIVFAREARTLFDAALATERGPHPK